MEHVGLEPRMSFGPVAPDTVHNIVFAAGTAVAGDYPAGAHFMQVYSTVDGFISHGSTAAAVPAASLTNGSSGFECFPAREDFKRAIVGGSTGYSVVAPTSGYASISFWS